MTHEEYANVFLEESGMPCLVTDCELRNIWESAHGLEMGTLSRVASGISGTATLMLYLTSLTKTQVVRSGDYIYIGNAVNSAGLARVIEYKISTATSQYIDIVNNPSYSVYNVLLSVIEGRKILMYDDNDFDWSNVYILDFETLTYSVTTTQNYPFSLITQRKSNGDIWLYVLGYGVSNAVELKYKNYTQDTAWGLVSQSLTWNGDGGPVIIDEDYIVFFYYVSGTPDSGGAVIFNLNTYTASLSNTVSQPTHTGNCNWNVTAVVQDITTGKAYATYSGVQLTNPSPPLWTSVDQWLELNPSTGVLTEIFSRVGYNLTSVQTYSGFAFSTKTNAYIMKQPEKILYKASDLSELGTFTIPYQPLSICYQMDDNGDIWWFEDGNTTLYRDNLNGTNVDSFVLDVVMDYGTTNIYIYHAKDSLIMFIHEQQPSTYNHFYRWYYIT